MASVKALRDQAATLEQQLKILEQTYHTQVQDLKKSYEKQLKDVEDQFKQMHIRDQKTLKTAYENLKLDMQDIQKKELEAMKKQADAMNKKRESLLTQLEDLRVELQKELKKLIDQKMQEEQIQKNLYSELAKQANLSLKDLEKRPHEFFFPGELTVIGARPGVGKSAFGANVALEAARKGYRVAVVSREMTDVQYGQRMMSRGALVDGMKLRKASLDDDDWMKMTEALTEMSTLPISFMFSVTSIEDLRIEVQRKMLKGELDMLIVDYLQLMQTRQKFRDQEHLRIGYISKALKAMAVDFNIPVIALAQVNRDSDGQMPTMRNLKASGDIEQDADNIIFLHKPANSTDRCVYPEDRQTFEAFEALGYVYLCIAVAKQRQGATGNICLLFEPSHMRYLEIDRTERREIHAVNHDDRAAEGHADAD